MQEKIHVFPCSIFLCLQQGDRKQKQESPEMDIISYLDNLDIMLGNENINPIERELANAIGELTAHYDIESNVQERENTSQENDLSDFSHENMIPRQDRLFESMDTFTNDITLRLSQEMDSLMSMMHTQINRAISSAISERVIPEIQIIMSSISSQNRDTESGSSSNN